MVKDSSDVGSKEEKLEFSLIILPIFTYLYRYNTYAEFDSNSLDTSFKV